jgi:hypothetical protein
MLALVPREMCWDVREKLPRERLDLKRVDLIAAFKNLPPAP